MKRKIRTVSFLCALMLLCSLMLTPAFAASKYTYFKYGNMSNSFEITTGNAKRKLTFEQRKGTVEYENVLTGISSYDTYGRFLIYITCDGELYKSLRFDFEQKLSVTLPKNKTYTVSVIPRSPESVFATLVEDNKIQKWKLFGFDADQAYNGWETLPDWSVTSPVCLENWESATPAW